MDEDHPKTGSIASVGFNNLKKLNTNSSVSTTTLTTSSIKPNPLSRLFTRNRSNSTIDDINLTDEEKFPISSPPLERKSSNVFRLSKAKRKGKNTKDLTVQTEGLPQPVLTRKSSVSSPVLTLHNLFHRNTISNLPSAGIESIEEQVPRSTINLLSNNSNSVLSDGNFAQVFKFTDINYSIEDDGDENEAFKKLLMPADQFLKLKGPGSPASMHHDDNFEGEKFWQGLVALVRPVILQSQQRKLANGLKGSVLTMTEEDIANYVREGYTTTIHARQERDDVKITEVTQDVLKFFNKILTLFDKDFKVPVKDDMDNIAKGWIRLHGQWIYFRNKILFFLLHCFSSLNVDIEKLLLLSFKEMIIEPFIDWRGKNSRDKDFLVNYMEGKLLDDMVHCFGMVNIVDSSLSYILSWLMELQ